MFSKIQILLLNIYLYAFYPFKRGCNRWPLKNYDRVKGKKCFLFTIFFFSHPIEFCLQLLSNKSLFRKEE